MKIFNIQNKLITVFNEICFLIILSFVIVSTSYAQGPGGGGAGTLGGTGSVYLNDSEVYPFTPDSNRGPVQSVFWVLTGVTGSITNASSTQATVNFTSVGTASVVATVTYTNDPLNDYVVFKSVTVSHIPPPTPNGFLTESISCESTVLSFSNSPGTNITWYWQGTNANGQSELNPSTYTATADGTYYLRAKNTVTNTWSVSSQSFNIDIDEKPSFPTLSNPTSINATSFVARWQSVAGVSSYRLDVSTANTFSSFVSGYNKKTVSGTSHSVTGLDAGRTYYYRLRAVKASCTSDDNTSPKSATTTIAAPTVSAASNISTTSFRANWNAASGVTNYVLYVSENSNLSSPVLTQNVTGTNYTVSSGLTPGKTYYYGLKSDGVNSDSGNSNPTQAVVLPISAPTVTTTVSSTNSSITINWTSVNGAEEYLLDVSDDGFLTYVDPAGEGIYQDFSVPGTVTSFVVAGLLPGTTYDYRLRAVGDNGQQSSESNTRSHSTTITAPTVQAESARTTTSFQANWSSVSGVSNYLLYVSPTSSPFQPLSGYNGLQVSANNHVVSGLTPGKEYYYRVNSKGPDVNSSDSGTRTAYTNISTTSTLAATSKTNTSFQANWNTVSGAVSYGLYVYDNTGVLSNYNNKTISGQSTGSASVTGLAAGKNYYYRVRVRGEDKTSGYSSGNTSTNTNIQAPASVAASGVTSSGFTANWGAVSGVTSYLLSVSTNPGFTANLSNYNNKVVTGTSHSVTGLSIGTAYYYRLIAVAGTPSNNATQSSYQVVNIPIGTPVATGSTAATDATITVAWNVVSGATEYLLDVSSDGFSNYVNPAGGGTYQDFSVPGGNTSFTIIGLDPGKNYAYRLKAKGSNVTSSESNEVSISTLMTAPSLSAASNLQDNSFQANWQATPGAASYRLDVASDIDFDTFVTNYSNKVVTGTSASVTGLIPGKTYYYRLRALSADNKLSLNSAATTGQTTISAPAGLGVNNIVDTGFDATWTVINGISSYSLDVSAGNSPFTPLSGYSGISVSDGSHTITGLTPGKNYYYRLRANGDNASSGNSGVRAFTTTISPPVLNYPINITNSSFTASWQSISGISQYNVDVFEGSASGIPLTTYDGLLVNGTQLAISSLAPGRNYFIIVRSKGTAISSADSEIMEISTTITSPVAVQESNVTGTSFTANWNQVVGSLNYRVDVANDNTFNQIRDGYEDRLISGSESILLVENLEPGEEYYYRVRAEGDGVVSINSNIITAATELAPEIDFMGSPILQNSGDKVVLVADRTYDSYTWKRNGTTISGSGSTVTVTTAGDYTLTVSKSGISGTKTSPVATVSNYSGFEPGDHNYVMSSSVLVEGMTTESAVDALTSDDKTVSIQYNDGLGRAIQTVAVEASPDKKHLVQHMTYDAFGRQTKGYLPYVVTDNGGVFQHNPSGNTVANYDISPQYDFYQATTAVAQDIAPYGESILENSPMGRVLKQGAPGAAWQPVQGSTTDKVVRMRYELNTAGEVALYKMNDTFVDDGFYAANELTKSVTEDEDGNEMVEYTDKLGRVILKKVETGDTNEPWANTHYVYDDFGNLRIVLPPEAIKALVNNSLSTVPAGYTLATNNLIVTASSYSGGSYMYANGASVTLEPGVTLDPGSEIIPYGISGEFLDQWAFQYEYDDRNRMTQKRVPGAGWVYMVYDKLDRLVLTQDANQRNSHQWTFTKYDVHGRPALTGFYTNSGSLATVQAAVTAHSILYENIGTTVLGYTNLAFPSVSSANDYLSVTYYDDYNNLPSGFGLAFESELGNTTSNINVKGQTVGSQTKVLDGSNTWLKSAVYYDDRYRVIQSKTQNHLGGVDRSSSKYDFVGRVLETKTTHDVDGTTAGDILVAETFTYDHASRLLKATHQVDSDPEVTLVENEYNAIGELIDKKLHSTDNGTSFEQSVDYRYNIRGWLERINDADLSDNEGDYFGMELAYNSGFSGISSTDMFNGNISAAKWSNIASGGTMQSAYAYSYDKLNRLTGADYMEKESTWSNTNKFDVNTLSYDLNGNIESLKRFATNTSLAMDHLAYSYTGNQLQSVTDTGDTSDGFKDGNTSGNDYGYDDNGNMINDANKDITSIIYNHLNLPKVVSFTGGRSITYTYDAAGIKLAKTTNDNGTIKVTDYNGGFIYEDDVLQQLATAEGRVRRKDDGDMVYDYYLKDHLGNSRVTFTTENEEVVYLATMETDNDGTTDFQAFEESLFLNLPATRVDTPPTANNSGVSGITNDESAMLRGNDMTRQVGPAKLLEVMAGDVVDMEAFAYHTGTYTDNGAIANASVLATIISTVTGAAPVGAEGSLIESAINGNSAAIFVGGDGSSSGPRAYLNYILFDKDFNYLDAGFAQVSATSGTHVAVNRSKSISEKGYLYVYVSNESDNSFDVFFDDLRITHTKGKILQEDHYYPFGANISALSSTAPLSKPNQFKYNEGSELVSNFNLGVYETAYRMLDPILGRWWQIDPMADDFPSLNPYMSMENDPIAFNDPLGLCPDCPDPENAQEGDTASPNGVEYTFNGTEWVKLGNAGAVVVTPDGNHSAANPSRSTNNRTGYIYDRDDLRMRLELLELGSGNVINKELARRERTGNFQPITAQNYLRTVDERAARMMFFGHSMWPAPGSGARFPSIRSVTMTARYSAVGSTKMIGVYDIYATHGMTLSRSKFSKLKADIRKNGIKEPIKYTVYRGKKYVVNGHHRLRAARQLGIKKIPAEEVSLPYAGYKNSGDLVFTRY